MPKQIQKTLQVSLSKLKFPLNGCKHVRTASFAGGGEENDGVTLSDVDRFLFENFKSLYQEECEEGILTKKAPFMFLEPPLPVDLSPSPRFFVESGSSSSRITDEPFSAANESSAPSVEAPEADGSLAQEDFIALMTYSSSPYDDFRRSMQEMVELRLEHGGKVDWAFLEELLFCYLDLNDRKSYRYILRAFVDVIVILRESSGKSPEDQPPLDDEV